MTDIPAGTCSKKSATRSSRLKGRCCRDELNAQRFGSTPHDLANSNLASFGKGQFKLIGDTCGHRGHDLRAVPRNIHNPALALRETFHLDPSPQVTDSSNFPL